jgi:hypothetical protein
LYLACLSKILGNLHWIILIQWPVQGENCQEYFNNGEGDTSTYANNSSQSSNGRLANQKQN